MKTRLIITDRSWEYRLHAAPQEPGKYYATLRALDGARISPAVACGPFHSLDFIQENAVPIYLGLVARREASAAAGAMNAGHHDGARQREDGASPEARPRGEPERAPAGREGEQITLNASSKFSQG